MAVDFRSVPFPITGGLTADTDDFASEGNVRVRDCRFRLDGQISKRSGATDRRHTGLPTFGTVDRNTITELDGVPMLLANDGTYRFDSHETEWRAMNVGAPRPSRLTTSPLVRTNDNLLRPDCAVIGDLLCAVWEDEETVQGFYGFWDVSEDTPRLVAGPKAFAATIKGDETTDHLRVIAVGGTIGDPDRFVVVGRDPGGDLRQTSYQLSAGDYTFVSPTLIAVTAAAYVTVEPNADATEYYVAANSAGTARLWRYDKDSAFIASVAYAAVADGPFAMIHNDFNTDVVGISSSGRLTRVAQDLSGVVTVSTILNAPTSGAPFTFARSAICLADEVGGMWVARSYGGTTPYSIGSPICTQMVAVDSTYAAVSNETVVGQFVLAGQAFYTPLTGPVFCVADQFTPETTDPTIGVIGYKAAPVGYYVRPGLRAASVSYDVALYMCGRFCQDTLYPFELTAHLSHVCTNRKSQGTSTSRRTVFMAASVGASSASSYEGRKVDLVASSHYYADAARNVTAQGIRLLGNGCGTTMTDGMMVAENTPPVAGYLVADGYDTTVTQSSNVYWSGAQTSARIVIVWRWYDAKGNVHRGAPSSPYETSSPTNGIGFNPIKICFPKYLPTGLMGDQFTTPEVEVYMFPTGVSDAEYRLMAIVPPADDTSEEGRSYIVLINLTVSVPASVRYGVDATTGSWNNNTITLYTDSGELASWPSPPLLDIVSTQSRMWGLSAEGQRLDVWYTKPMVEGRAPEWSELLRVLVPQEGGDVVALAGLDDKVAVLKRRRIFVITGDPGDQNGNGSSMQRPRALASDVGCIDVNSVVEGPFGVAFLSERGWYTLSRDLTLTFIGQPMIDAFAEDWNTVTYPQPAVLSTTLVPNESEVRWAIESVRGTKPSLGATWNYRLNKWTVATSYDVRSSVVVDGVEWRMGTVSATAVRQETPGAWLSGEPLIQRVDSPWIKLNGLAGFQRVRRIVLTFRWYSADISITTVTDYLAVTETTKQWSASTLATLVDTTTRRVQLVVYPTVQKCEALRIYIVGVLGSEAGRGWELVGCQLDIGVKKGSNKKFASAARK
jgi:hypothetical protein